jgi:hypothetical protein
MQRTLPIGRAPLPERPRETSRSMIAPGMAGEQPAAAQTLASIGFSATGDQP